MRQDKERLGSSVLAAGVILEAISATENIHLGEETRSRLLAYANVLAAVGNATIADTLDELDAEKLGLKTLTTGNLAVTYGNVVPDSDEDKTKLTVKGNLIQTLGGSLALTEVFNPKGSKSEILLSYGVTLITAGAAIISIGGSKELRNIENRLVEIGAWVKALGATLVMLSFFLPDKDM
ncbi:hypothetical protein J2Z83_001272 [Virgibacillus natechei]|uniref:Uncharacterized protein n=1 Tax=Virgibacillus natechei TaxID=1216297 RepID=A0ABS4IDZ6_9BACI|nr:hypothetical protein [Virgibacillus natechei]MBP1969169.1 hypothetical protein [Virgibacillus natechei]UZD14424.1 hypothetical protein OLD84_07985 [Virgibacillus natechei]